MISKNSLSLSITAFLIIGFFIVALPEKGYSGTPVIETGCCQFSEMREVVPGTVDNRFASYTCEAESSKEVCNKQEGEFVPFALCSTETGMCNQIQPTRNVPTLSEWGLIATAGFLGIIGFVVIRRRKAAA